MLHPPLKTPGAAQRN